MKRLIILSLILFLTTGFFPFKGIFAQVDMDLFIRKVNLSKTIIFEGDSFDVFVYLGVEGDKEEIEAEHKVMVSLFWDVPSRFTLIDSKITTIDNKNILIKFTVDLEEKNSLISESMKLVGDKFLVVEVDSGHDLEEINEKNNLFKKKIHIFSRESKVIDLWIGKKTALIDDKEYELDVPPTIVNGRTLVPIRFIAEGFGGEVLWDGDEKRITINMTKTEIVMWIGKKTALIDDKEYELDVPPTIVNGRTLVPIRFIAEGFGSFVFWFGKEKRVTIIYEG